MHRHARFLTALIVFGCAFSGRARAGEARSVWLVSNGFHSSLAFRRSDLPLGREVTGHGRSDGLLIGWGASDFYRRRVNPCTFLKAMCWPEPGVIHLVPFRGSVATRFRHSDVIQLSLSEGQFRTLLRELDAAFARDADGRRVLLGRGYFEESRFYQGSERFYFPKMCNVWVAQKLRRSGVPVCVATAMAASELVWQVEKLGKRQQRLRKPVDAF